MKNLSITVIILFSTAAAAIGTEEPLANANKTGLYARSIEQVLRLDDGDIDLATAALLISEQWSNVVGGRKYLSRLDDMAYEIRSRLKARNLPLNYKAIAVINEYLFDELGFQSISEASNPDDLFLHTVLDRKQGYCLSLSVLYLSIGERLGLPLYGVVVPGHFFVRYDDGRVRFNIETTSKGGYADDEHYINKFNVPKSGSEGIYMKNLNKLETLGCFFNNLGNSYSTVGNIDSAQLALERAVAINPSLAESLTNLGNIYLQKGRIEDAIDQYRRALRINPADAKTHNNLGNGYARKEWFKDAAFEYAQAVRLDPNFTDAYKNMAVAYCKEQRFDNAVSALRQAIVLSPKDSDIYNQLGGIYSQMEDCEQAIPAYEKALNIKPNLAVAYCGLAVCYGKAGQVDDEINAYKKALEIEPDTIVALTNLGNVYFGRQKYDDAIEYYNKAVRIKPDDAIIHYNLGAAYSNKGSFEQAAAEYLKAVEIDPKMGAAHNGLGLAFYNLKKYDLAWKHIKIAEELGEKVADDLLAAIKNKLQ